jgi:hypothetical protein
MKFTKEVYLKWYECYFGESLKTNLQHTYKQKVRGFLLINGQEAVLAGALQWT